MREESEQGAFVRPKVLFVDDEQAILNALERFSRIRQWDVRTALSAIDALDIASQEQFDVVVSDMRIPKMDGADFLLLMKKRHPDTIRILLTGYSDIEALERVVNESGINSYVTKPWDDIILEDAISTGFKLSYNQKERKRLEELTQKQNKKLGRLALIYDKKLKESVIETEQALTILSLQEKSYKAIAQDSLSIVSQILDWKNGHNQNHARFVEEYCDKLGVELGLSEHQLEELRIASILHRVGSLGLSDKLKGKPTYSLNIDERTEYKQYPALGEVALSSSPHLKNIGKIVRHHQEYVDGSGYPDGLIFSQIPIESKIICLVTDFFDVFNGRKEKNLSGVSNAKEYINQWAGKRYETNLIDAFWKVLTDFGDNAKTTKALPITQLQIGDELAEDILTDNGLLLLKRNSVITKDILNQLTHNKNLYNNQTDVFIYKNKSEQKENKK